MHNNDNESFKIGDHDGSPWLKADHLDAPRTVVTITRVSREEVGRDKETKVILAFKDFERRLICNPSAIKSLKQIFGERAKSEELIGRTIVLAVREELVFDAVKRVIRIERDGLI